MSAKYDLFGVVPEATSKIAHDLFYSSKKSSPIVSDAASEAVVRRVGLPFAGSGLAGGIYIPAVVGTGSE